MNSLVRPSESDQRPARENRERLRLAGVYSVNLIGGPGCGKTSLIEATIRRLLLKRRVGAIAADPHSRYDADRLLRLGHQVLHVDPGGRAELTAAHLRSALRQLDLSALDLLLIENVSSLIGPSGVDLGEDVKVGVFSVAAGHDKPARNPDVVCCAAAVVLNKIDLLKITPFELGAFRETVARCNPAAAVFEMSTLTGDGVDAWVEWVLSHAAGATGSSASSSVPPRAR